jgi:ethanolamine ammonia-lyase small subunit
MSTFQSNSGGAVTRLKAAARDCERVSASLRRKGPASLEFEYSHSAARDHVHRTVASKPVLHCRAPYMLLESLSDRIQGINTTPNLV